MTASRKRRAGVEDRWTRTVRQPDGTTKTEQSAKHGKGSRWRARYVGDDDGEREKLFGRKADAQTWLDNQVSDQVTGAWTDPTKSTVTFGAMAERWIATKATRSPKTVAGYRSILDTIVLARWRDVPLREVRYDDLQVWITGLSADGSVRFEGSGLSASRVRQTHQLVGAVLKFAVRAKHLPANPADGIDLPDSPRLNRDTSPTINSTVSPWRPVTSVPSCFSSAIAACDSARRQPSKSATSTWLPAASAYAGL